MASERFAPTDDAGYAELSLTKGIQRGNHRNSLFALLAFSSTKALRAPLSRSVDPAHAAANAFPAVDAEAYVGCSNRALKTSWQSDAVIGAGRQTWPRTGDTSSA
jgi:hypothetical protein